MTTFKVFSCMRVVCVIVSLFFVGVLTVTMIVKCLPPAIGDLTIDVARMVAADSSKSPDLQLEIEVRNESQFSAVYPSRNEAFVYKRFYFEHVGWNDALIFRLRDAFVEHKPIIGILVTSPSTTVSAYKQIYDLTPRKSWIVMKVDWAEKRR